MAEVKITALPAYADPASTDVLPIVDVAADLTKKVSIADLLENAATGSASSPSFAFDGDSNTGMYRSGADALAFSTGGTGRLFINSSGNVGVGTASPGARLDVADTNPTLRLTSTFNANPTIGDSLASVDFYSSDSSSNGPGVNCYVRAVYEDTFGADVALTFATTSSNNDGTEKLRITHGGLVGIGTPSPVRTLHLNVDTSNACLMSFTNATTGAGSGDGMQVGLDNAENARVWQLENGNLDFGTNNTLRMRIDSSGRLLVGTATARNKVYNGTTSTNVPQFQTEVSGSGVISRAMITGNPGTNTSDVGPALILARSAGTTDNSYTAVTSAANHLGAVSFQGADGSEFVEGARIEALVDGTPGANNMPGRLVFSTTADGSSSPSPRMYINSSGNVGIGTSSPARQLTLYNSSTPIIQLVNSTTGQTANDGVMLYESGSDFVIENQETGNIRIYNAGTERMRIDSSGNVGIGGTPTNDANTTTFEVITDATTARMILTSNAVGGGKYGWYTNNEGQLAAYDYTAASERMRIDSSGNVGIGTASPGDWNNSANQLVISKADDCGITIDSTSSTGSSIHFGDGSTGNESYRGIIRYDNSDDSMRFGTSAIERARIDSSGRLLLGLTSSIGGNALLQVQGSGNRKAHFHQPDSGSSVLQFTNTTTDAGTSDGFEIALNGSAEGQIWNYEGTAIKFGTTNTERMRILAGGGLTFNGDTAQANALDDYEEGTFTATITQSTTAPAVTYTRSHGRYTKIGKFVLVWFDIIWSAKSGGTGFPRIAGLPYDAYAVGNQSGGYGAPQFRSQDGLSTNSRLYGNSSHHANDQIILKSFNSSGTEVDETFNSSGRITGFSCYMIQ